MRIGSGVMRGMKVSMPNNHITRPTLVKTREAVFNMLGNDLRDVVFWDLFAGSGVMGLTACSLGAQQVVFVEKNLEACRAIRRNIAAAKERHVAQKLLPPHLQLLQGDLRVCWKRLRLARTPLCVWADPPYASSLVWAQFLFENLPRILPAGGIFCLEAADSNADQLKEFFSLDPLWVRLREKSYGGTLILMGVRG